MRVVVLAGTRSDKVVHVVHCRLADRPAVGPGRKGLACALLHSERGDRVDQPLLQSNQILAWFDHDSHQGEILVGQVIQASRLALPMQRLLRTQHVDHGLRDRIEVRRGHKPLQEGDVRRVVGIEGETAWIICAEAIVRRLCPLNGGCIWIQQDVDGDQGHGAFPFLEVDGVCVSS